MPDLMQQLKDARPAEAELDRMWPAEQRAEALARVIGTPRGTTRRPRRVAWLAATAAAVVGVAALPVMVDSGSAAARADLEALALAAVSSEGPVIAEGTFLHVTTESQQRNSAIFGDGETREIDRESWVRWDGRMWAIDSRPSAGWREYFVFPRAEEGFLGNPTPEFAASLPDEPEALRAYLDEHVSGSSSHEEAIFVAITDLARSYFLPPETLAAALEVLADIDGVRTKDVTVQGRAAVRITHLSFWHDLVMEQSTIVDRETARVVSDHESNPGGTYDRTITLVEVVDEIPADVLADFERAGPGGRLDD